MLSWSDCRHQGIEDSAVVSTPAGKFALYSRAEVLVRSEWCRESCREYGPHSDMLAGILQQLRQYWHNPGMVFSFSLLRQGTEFRKRVWQELLYIPAGQTVSYAQLAEILDSSPRAIGGACRENPWPLFVPCHRVVAASGIGGYAGQTGGGLLQIKRRLLNHEGVPGWTTTA